MVNETTVIVFIISAWGHYDDKWRIAVSSETAHTAILLNLWQNQNNLYHISKQTAALVGSVGTPPCRAALPDRWVFCGVPDTFCCAVLLGISVVYRACGFRVCLRVWDRFYLSPSPLLISRWGGCSIEQQEETGQALFFPLALRGYALKIKALEKLTAICWL